MGFEYLDHTADLAVRAWGTTLGELFDEAARALFSSMLRLEHVRAETGFEVEGSAGSVGQLLMDWLSTLAAQKEVSGLVFSDFAAEISRDGRGWHLRATARGERLDLSRHEPAVEVKGISAFGLRVWEEATGWQAQFVVDV
jgi:SHS2 domain-containing protein